MDMFTSLNAHDPDLIICDNDLQLRTEIEIFALQDIARLVNSKPVEGGLDFHGRTGRIDGKHPFQESVLECDFIGNPMRQAIVHSLFPNVIRA